MSEGNIDITKSPAEVAIADAAPKVTDAEKAAKKAADAEAKEKLKAQKEAEKAAKAAARAKEKAERDAQREAEKAAKAEAKKAEKEAARLARQEAKKAAEAEKQKAREAAKARKEAERMPEQNGIRRPKPDTLCGQAWKIFDDISAKNGAPASIGESMPIAREAHLNEANVRAEYARWRKFYGITGRISNPTAVAEPVGTEVAPSV